MDADDIIKILNLEPLKGEGGFFRETYRSRGIIPHHALPSVYHGDKNYGTAIYYMVTPDTFSALHRLPGDEIFHFYLGDPVIMLQLDIEGGGKKVILGKDIERGQNLQVVVPGGVWQGLYLMDGGKFALLGTTMVPAFDYEDFELGNCGQLKILFPSFSELIEKLTR
jgi:uncharacterized protein